MVKSIYFNDIIMNDDYLDKFEITKTRSVIDLIKNITNEEYNALIVQSNFTDISVKVFIDLVKYLSPDTSIIFVGKINDELEKLLYDLNVECIIDLNKSASLNESILDRFLENLNKEMKRYIIERKYNLEIDLMLKIVKKDSEPIKLSSTEYNLLEYLVINRGRALSRQEIEQQIWGNNISEFESRVIDVYILKLRRKFGNDCIKTVRGKGYIWNC